MNNKEFLKELKEIGVNKISDLPSGYDYSLTKKTLTLKLTKKGVSENMQKDICAFDSWAFALKHYCAKFVDTIEIDWEEPDILNQHFNRFVYRLTRFVQTYEWASAKKPIPSMPSLLYCSAPNKKAAPKEKHNKGDEGWIECDFVERNKKKYDAINHQLPVGLFDGVVKDTTHFTPGKLSQIDIWAIDGNTFMIFELKKPRNNKLGIISELMFYTNVVNDLLSHNILISEEKAKKAVNKGYRSFDKFYETYTGARKINQIKSVFLADELHSLINDDVLKLINDSVRLKRFNITFETAKP